MGKDLIIMPIYYLEINIVCIVILLTIFDKFKDECEINHTSKYYEKTLLATTFFSFFDLIGGILGGTMYEYNRLVLIVSNSLYFFSGSLIGYFYTNYILHKIGKEEKKWQKALIFIPVLLVTILLVINLFNGMLFTINENNLYSRGKYIYLFSLIIATYIIVMGANLVYCYFKNIDNKKLKEEFKKLLIFTSIPIVSALIQNFNYGITLGQVGLTLSVLLIYLNGQKKDSNIDELTGIYNRRAFNRNVSRLFNSKKLMFLMLMDANDFKMINDKYGHLEGDKALVAIANILKNAISNTDKDYFLARYGGDEFIIVGEIKSQDDVDELMLQIEEEEKRYNKETKNKYNIKLSIGYSLRNNEHTSVESLIEAADNKMYARKKEMKKGPKTRKITA